MQFNFELFPKESILVLPFKCIKGKTIEELKKVFYERGIQGFFVNAKLVSFFFILSKSNQI